MNPTFHISDADLQSSIMEGTPQCSMDELEQHLAECSSCRERLERFAASAEWRGKIRESLIATVGHESFELTQEHRKADWEKASYPSEDAFDLPTALRELKPLLQPATHPELLGRIGRYDIEKPIGRGCMGVVVKGFDTELHRPVAIKIMLPRWSANGTARQRFAREARAAAAILHPNVIAIHGVDEIDSVPYLVMPYIAGPTLQSLVESTGPLPENEIVRIAKQIASGLAAAHSQGLVHRDIKPGNILVDQHGHRVWIVDFGLVRAEHDASMTQTGWIAGTPNFMSPEQCRGMDVDGRSDLFSLGSVLYFLATGALPFAAEAPMGVLHRIGNEEPQSVRKRNETISATLAELIERLMAKKPEHRFQTAAELERYLEQYITYLHRPGEQRRPPRLKPLRSKRRIRGLVAGTVALVVSTSLFAMWSWGLGPFSEFSSPTPPTAPEPALATWPELVEKYELLGDTEYDRQIEQLTLQVEALQQSMTATDSIGEENTFLRQWNDLKHQLENDFPLR